MPMTDIPAATGSAPAGADTLVGSVKARRRLSTGNLLFIVLTIALAPLGAIAFGASARTIITSDSEREILLQVAVTDKAERLARLLDADASRMAQALTAIRKGESTAPPASIFVDDTTATDVALPVSRTQENPFASACQAAASTFPGGTDRPMAQVLDSKTGADRCTAGVPPMTEAASLMRGKAALDTRNDRLIYALASVGADGMLVLVYPLSVLDGVVGSSNRLPPHRAATMAGDQEHVFLDAIGDVPGMLRLESRAPIGQTGLLLSFSASRSWFNGPELIGLITPLGMWLLAALLSWLVVDRVLLTPIQRLNRSMGNYRPGDRLDLPQPTFLAAGEVDMLQATIASLTGNVAADRAALDVALDAQRALTREVHHRVKNNLQIIASLISLHSRDAGGPSEIAAYRGIQRRVDALAVVHRHLHSDGEDSAGIALGTMLGELSVGLRHSLASEHGAVALTVNVDVAQTGQDVALPVAFFVTELVELACLCDPSAPIAIEMHLRPGGLACLSVRSPALADCVERAGSRYSSYERVLSGLSRQLRQPLQHDRGSGRYAIDVPVLPPRSDTAMLRDSAI